jgi:hypothetical protein
VAAPFFKEKTFNSNLHLPTIQIKFF